MVKRHRASHRKFFHSYIKSVFFHSVNIVFLKTSISAVFAQGGQPVLNSPVMRQTYQAQSGLSAYSCYDEAISCTAWNADRVVNPDAYKDIHVSVGGFNLTFPKGRPTLTSGDNRFSISLGLSFQVDTGEFIGPDKKANGSKMGGNQTFIRRGRFAVALRYDDFILTVTPDMGRPALVNDSIYESSLKYVGLKNTVIALGLFQPSVTMQDSESSNGFILVERPMIIDLVRNISGSDARLAFMATHWEKGYYVSATVTGQRLGKTYQDFQKNEIGGIVRAVVHPVAAPHYDLHLGVSSTFAIHGNTRGYSMSSGPEAQVWLGRPYLRTGSMQGVDSIWAVGPEFALRVNRFLIQSEYYSIFLHRVAENFGNRPDLRFSGWYISVNYTLLGQPRNYDQSRAIFNPPVGTHFNPAVGEWGALEWSARWSSMDMNDYAHRVDRIGRYIGVRGGRQNVISTGFNWYPSDHMRFSLDYNHVMATRSRNNYYNLTGRTSNLVMSRVQLSF